MKKFFTFLFFVAFSLPLYAGAVEINLLLNGEAGDATLNPISEELSIEITSDETISYVTICSLSAAEADCSYTSYARRFNGGATFFSKQWDGKNKDGGDYVADGDYYVKVFTKISSTAKAVGEPFRSSVITVSSSEVPTGENNNDDNDNGEGDDVTPDTSTTTTTTTTTTSSSGSSSSHSSQSDLSSGQEEIIKIGAGRPRLAVVGMPIVFRAEGERKSRISYRWSFGDGSEKFGREAEHVYQFPGDYQVVLNASYGASQEAVSRTTVKIVEPQIYLTALNPQAGYVEISNQSEFEANLFGWTLSCDIHKFSFPLDTIITAGGAIKIPLAVAGCAPNVAAWKLVGPGWMASSTLATLTPSEPVSVVASVVSDEAARRERVAKAVAEARRQLASQNLLTTGVLTPEVENTETVNVAPDAVREVEQSASVIILGDTAEQTSWWGKIKSLFR